MIDMEEDGKKAVSKDSVTYPEWAPKILLSEWWEYPATYSDKEFADLKHRFASDRCMEKVWRNLFRRDQKNKRFLELPDRFRRIALDFLPLLIAETVYQGLYRNSVIDRASQVGAGKRKKLLAQVESSAKDLISALDELGLPEDVFHYASAEHYEHMSGYLANFLLVKFDWLYEPPEIPAWVTDDKSLEKFYDETSPELPEWAPETANRLASLHMEYSGTPRLKLIEILQNVSNVKVLKKILPPVYLKKEGIDNARTYTIRLLSHLFNQRFGTPLHESVATIISVATGEDISREIVRSALKGFQYPNISSNGG